MDVTISCRHVELPDAVRASVQEKLDRLHRFDVHLTRAEVHLDEERNPRIAQPERCAIEVAGPGCRVYAQAFGADVRSAFDATLAKVEQQLHKQKTRALQRAHGG